MKREAEWATQRLNQLLIENVVNKRWSGRRLKGTEMEKVKAEVITTEENSRMNQQG